MERIFVRFQSRLGDGVGPVAQAELLGVSYRAFASYRAGKRALPTYMRRHMEALILLSDESLMQLIRKHIPRVLGIEEDEL